MAKRKSKTKVEPKSKTFQIIIGVVLLAFIVFMLADLMKKPSTSTRETENRTEVYEFKKHGELTFQSSDGDYIDKIDIEIADNDYERAQGLMYRTEMAEQQGMLFIFPREERQSFWMKNTVLSLDMFFINSNLEIVTIHENTVPYAQQSYPSTAPAQYVLETIAGYSKRHNIKVGSKVLFRKTN